MKSKKWFVYQIIALLSLMILLFVFDLGLEKTGILLGDEINIYIKGGILFSVLTWIYMSVYFESKKPSFFQRENLKEWLPFVWSFTSLLVAITFIMIVSKGPFLRWIHGGSWFLYILLICGLILYYFLIFMIVHRVSKEKDNVLHVTYAWSLGIIFILAFIF